MAPFSSIRASLSVGLAGASLRQDGVGVLDSYLNDPGQVKLLQVISLALASLSLLSTVFSFYWFVRMRRSFRHEYVPRVPSVKG